MCAIWETVGTQRNLIGRIKEMNLIAREFSFITPEAMGGKDTYERVCGLVGLEPVPVGYGLVHCIDKDDGDKHYTLVTTDVDYLRGLVGKPQRQRQGLEIPPWQFPLRREGWPDEWIKGH